MIKTDVDGYSYFTAVPTIPGHPGRLDAEARIAPFRFLNSTDRLHGVLMVAAVANWLNDPENPNHPGPVGREKLREAFFAYFDRNVLSKFSQNLDSDFADSLESAVVLDFVLRANADPAKYEDLFSGGFVQLRR
jgi:hypothetical protein